MKAAVDIRPQLFDCRPMFFDTHCHLTANSLRDEFAGLTARAAQANVTHVLNIGDTLSSSRDAVVQCSQSRVWMRAAAGVHPQNALEWTEKSASELKQLAAHPAIAAIGEIGLDWVYDDSHPEYPGATRLRQIEVFREQLRLARELGKPVIIHNRESDQEIMEVVASVPGTTGVVHCWAGSPDAAQRALELGLHLGFTGLVTFKNAGLVREALALCPLDRLLIETDAPYLAPVPFRGKRNEPAYVPYTARAVAEIKGISVEELAVATMNNGLRMFG